jgi:glycosyltransferase involved in cell wall biosynthesis
VEVRLAAADHLTDLLIGWLEMQLHEDERWENLRRFCDESLRRDLKNLSLYVMQVTTVMRDKPAVVALFARVGQWARELKLQDHVTFTGSYTQQQAVDIYRGADVLLHTQYNDACPSVVLEAMACGLPVVYSNSGGVGELVGA